MANEWQEYDCMVPQHNTPRGSALGAGPNNILHEHPTTQRHLTGVLTSVTRPVENRGLSRANQEPEVLGVCPGDTHRVAIGSTIVTMRRCYL